MATNEHSWEQAGFNNFFERSIESGNRRGTLEDTASYYNQTTGSNEINFDGSPTTGSLGSSIQVGQHINIDGTTGRIAVTDQGNNEVVRLGDLGD